MSYPPQMPSRDLRRHHEARLKRRVAHYYGGNAGSSARKLGRALQTRTPCSCWMCGNPRRHHLEKTMQERIADELWRE